MTKREAAVYRKWNIEMGEYTEKRNRVMESLKLIAADMGRPTYCNMEMLLAEIMEYGNTQQKQRAMRFFAKYYEYQGRVESLHRYLTINQEVK